MKGVAVGGQLSPEHERFLVNLAGVLLPGDAQGPSAADVLRDGLWLHRAIAADPPLAERLVRACDSALQIGGSAEVIARTLFDEHPSEFEPVALAISSAYFMAPEVHASLGWPGQVRRFAGTLEAAEDLDDEIFGPMLESPPRYREV